MHAFFRRVCLALICTLPLAVAPASEAYKRVGPGGVIEFSDQPSDDAEAVDIPPANTYRQVPLPPVAGETDRESGQQETPEIAVSIVSPADDEAVVNTAGNLTVRTAVEPALETVPGRRLRLLLDGRPVATAETDSLSLSNVDRGTHQLRVQVLDPDEQVLAESAPSTFHLIRPSVNLPGRK